MGLKGSSLLRALGMLWALDRCSDDPWKEAVVFSFYTSENRGSDRLSNFLGGV